MKTLTLTQPWATLVAIGAKTIETRSWAMSWRGPLAIHAAARAVVSTARHLTVGGNHPIVLQGATALRAALADYDQTTKARP